MLQNMKTIKNPNIQVVTNKAADLEEFETLEQALKTYPNLMDDKFFSMMNLDVPGNPNDSFYKRTILRFEDWSTYNLLSVQEQ